MTHKTTRPLISLISLISLNSLNSLTTPISQLHLVLHPFICHTVVSLDNTMDPEQKPLQSPDRRNFLRNAAAALTGAGLTAVGVKATEVSASPEQQPPQQQTETFYTRLGIHVESPVRASGSESPPLPEDTGGLSAISLSLKAQHAYHWSQMVHFFP